MCCGADSLYKEIHGDLTLIKLDIWHAIDRIKKSLPARHPTKKSCLTTLSAVFFNDNNHDEPTLNKHLLTMSFQTWYAKWKPIFESDKFDDAVCRLYKHIQSILIKLPDPKNMFIYLIKHIFRSQKGSNL